MTSMILIDLRKAFDTIDHDILLLQKLDAIGFSKHSVNWFRSYLINGMYLGLIWRMYFLILHAFFVNIMILMKLKNN